MTVKPHRVPIRALPTIHQADYRMEVYRAGDWDIRAFAVNDPMYTVLERHGALHLQLWHRHAQISILTPSSLTHGHYELVDGDVRERVTHLDGLVARMQARGGPLPPSTELVELFITRYAVSYASSQRSRVA